MQQVILQLCVKKQPNIAWSNLFLATWHALYLQTKNSNLLFHLQNYARLLEHCIQSWWLCTTSDSYRGRPQGAATLQLCLTQEHWAGANF